MPQAKVEGGPTTARSSTEAEYTAADRKRGKHRRGGQGYFKNDCNCWAVNYCIIPNIVKKDLLKNIFDKEIFLYKYIYYT